MLFESEFVLIFSLEEVRLFEIYFAELELFDLFFNLELDELEIDYSLSFFDTETYLLFKFDIFDASVLGYFWLRLIFVLDSVDWFLELDLLASLLIKSYSLKLFCKFEVLTFRIFWSDITSNSLNLFFKLAVTTVLIFLSDAVH